jgi:hypothetical protein
LGLDIQHTYHASVDIGRQTLRLVEEGLSLWSPRAGPQPSTIVVPKDYVIPAPCDGIVTDRLETPLGVENGLVEPSPHPHPPEGLDMARTLVQDRRKVPVRGFNVTHCVEDPVWHSVSQSRW